MEKMMGTELYSFKCLRMDATSPLDIFDTHHEDIQAIFRSRLLSQVLLALGAGNRSLSVLREITGSSSQALIPKIRQLESAGYVESVRGEYALTPVGRILESGIAQVVQLIGVLREHRDLWIDHDLESIPPEFLKDLGDLYNTTVVKSVEEDVFSVYRNFVRILGDAEWVHGLSSVTNPAFAEAIAQIAVLGTPVELVVSHDLAEKLAGEPYIGMLVRLAETPNFAVFVSPLPIRLGLTVTDGYLSLGLYVKGTDVYDAGVDLVGSDPSAVAWGERLFQYYRQNAERVTFAP